MAVSAARGKAFHTAASHGGAIAGLPCELSFKRTFDRYGELRLVPILISRLGETDFRRWTGRSRGGGMRRRLFAHVAGAGVACDGAGGGFSAEVAVR